LFPSESLRVERISETVLDLLIEPIGRAVMKLADAARQLQHGRLQFYVAYVLVGLSALGTYVAFANSAHADSGSATSGPATMTHAAPAGPAVSLGSPAP